MIASIHHRFKEQQIMYSTETQYCFKYTASKHFKYFINFLKKYVVHKFMFVKKGKKK